MRLTLHSEELDDVLVVRCQGRIVAGVEVEALQAEMEKHTRFPGSDILKLQRVALNLGEVDYIDSSGLGAIVRMYGILRNAGGGLTLCQVPAPVVNTLEITRLSTLLAAYASEADAIRALDVDAPRESSSPSGTTIVCLDTSRDLLAYLRALLAERGYKVHTTWNPMDGRQLVTATRPKLVICGPGILALPTAGNLLDRFKESRVPVLSLPPEFSTSDAGTAGTKLVEQVKSLLGS